MYEILSEATVEGLLGIGQWHHLSANVRDYIHNRKTVIEVRVLYFILYHPRCRMLLNILRTIDPVFWCLDSRNIKDFRSNVEAAGMSEMLADQ